jgi:hypothetical protein
MKIDARDLLNHAEVERLLAEIHRAAKWLQRSPGGLTAELVGNGRIPERLEAGGSVLHSTAKKLRALMDKRIKKLIEADKK